MLIFNKFKVFAFLFLVMLSCSEKIEKNEFRYSEDFFRYLEEVHRIEYEENTLFYLLDLQSCDPCIDANLKMLSELDRISNLTIILLAKPRFDKWDNELKKLFERQNILEDANSEAYLFELGLGKPMILYSVKKGEVFNYVSVSDFEIDKAEHFISNYAKY